jgi:hypothetical protein
MKKVYLVPLFFLSLAATPGCGVWEGLFGGDSKPLVENGIEVCDGRPADIRAAVLRQVAPLGMMRNVQLAPIATAVNVFLTAHRTCSAAEPPRTATVVEDARMDRRLMAVCRRQTTIVLSSQRLCNPSWQHPFHVQRRMRPPCARMDLDVRLTASVDAPVFGTMIASTVRIAIPEPVIALPIVSSLFQAAPQA